MINKNGLRKIIISLTILITSGYLLAFSVQAQGNGTYDVNAFKNQSGLDITANQGGYDTSANATTPEQLIGQVIYTVLGLVGVMFMGFVIYGGFTWMTAQGNQEKVKKANGILMSALFGLFVTLSAYVISFFLIERLWK